MKNNILKRTLDNRIFAWIEKMELRYPVRVYALTCILLLLSTIFIVRDIVLSQMGYLVEPEYDYSFVFNLILCFFVAEMWYIAMLRRRPSYGWRGYNFK